MIVIEVEGVQYGNFTSANVQLRLDALSTTFGFEATSRDGRPLPFQGGEACLVFVEGEQVTSGSIEIVNASYTARAHTISIQGRDKLGDLLDSTLGAIPDLKARTLKALAERVLREIGLDVKVIDEVNPKQFNPAEDIQAPDPGENAFGFLEKYSRKRGVLWTSDFDGNLVIAQASGVTTGGLIQNRVDNRGGSNNIVAAEVSYDSTGRYNLYRAVSQLNPTAGSLAGSLNPSSVASQGANQDVRDDQIRQGRQLILVSEAMTSSNDSTDRATWEANIRRARGRVYSPELSGFLDQEENLWALNTLPQVSDDFAGIEARMLINTVGFTNSVAAGKRTVLGMVERDAYTLTLEEPQEAETVGGGLFGG